MIGSYQLSPKGCLVTGTVLIALSLFELWVAVFRRDLLKRHIWLRARWGHYGEGPPVSLIGALAWAMAHGVFGALFILNGYFEVVPNSRVLPIFFGVFGLVLLAALYDYRRQRRK